MAFNERIAIELQKAGLLIFPLFKSQHRPFSEPKGWQRFKGSITSDGRDSAIEGETPATSDPNLVRKWAKNPAIVAYGVCAPNHIIFDLDVKKGKDGVTQFERLRESYNIPKPEFVVKSRSGGYHLYYNREDDVTAALIAKAVNLSMSKSEVYEGVDLVGNNGYVVGPQDDTGWIQGKYVIVKGDYTALNFSVCPTKVITKQIRAAGSVAATTGSDLVIELDADEETEELLSAIRSARVPDSIPAGNRDNLLTIFIGVLKQRRMPPDTVRLLCETFLDRCELSEGETREDFLKGIDLDSKLKRFLNTEVNTSDPRDVAKSISQDGGVYKCLDQLPGGMALIVTRPNPFLEVGIVYNETKARQDLLPYAKPIPNSDSPKPVNPYDLIMRDLTIPRVHSTGYMPRAVETFIEPADGTLRVNTYRAPIIPVVRYVPKNIGQQITSLAEDLCGDLADYMLDFMAHVVQRPHVKMGVAILLISTKQGTGKNTLVQTVRPCIGANNYLSVPGIRPLVEDKSIVLESNVLVVFNEVARPSNRGQWSDMSNAIQKLKTSITDNITQINPKYEKQRKITSYSNFMMLSNYNNAFDIEDDDRRLAVINNNPMPMDMAGKYKLIADFAHQEKNRNLEESQYNELVAEANEFYLTRKITHNLTHAPAPDTIAKQQMQESHYPPFVTALKDLREILGPGTKAHITSEEKIIYIVRHVLGYKDFARNRGQYDVFQPFLKSGLLRRVYQSDGKKSKVLTGTPNLLDREDFPLVTPPNKVVSPQKVFTWGDQDSAWDGVGDPALRAELWKDISDLQAVSNKSDVLSMIK